MKKLIIAGANGFFARYLTRHFADQGWEVVGLPATKWMAEVGAFLLRTETELILKSRWVVPTRLLEHGFVFNHPEMKPWEWRK